MRRTNATLSRGAKVDAKVSADQRGHGIGGALDIYTTRSIRRKGAAAKKLEDSVLGRKVVRMPEEKASLTERSVSPEFGYCYFLWRRPIDYAIGTLKNCCRIFEEKGYLLRS
jgi:hypothetical protein